MSPSAITKKVPEMCSHPGSVLFSSEGKYLKVNVFIRDEQVASFDCAPIELTSVPGNFIDLVIDGHYVKPVMQFRVNGWKVATIESNM